MSSGPAQTTPEPLTGEHGKRALSRCKGGPESRIGWRKGRIRLERVKLT